MLTMILGGGGGWGVVLLKICSELYLNEQHEHQTYLQPPPQHMVLVTPVVPEKCFLYTLVVVVQTQGCEYLSHSASLPLQVAAR